MESNQTKPPKSILITDAETIKLLHEEAIARGFPKGARQMASAVVKSYFNNQYGQATVTTKEVKK